VDFHDKCTNIAFLYLWNIGERCLREKYSSMRQISHLEESKKIHFKIIFDFSCCTQTVLSKVMVRLNWGGKEELGLQRLETERDDCKSRYHFLLNATVSPRYVFRVILLHLNFVPWPVVQMRHEWSLIQRHNCYYSLWLGSYRARKDKPSTYIAPIITPLCMFVLP